VRELLAEQPNQAELIVLEALLTAKTGNPAEAISALRTATGLRPDNLPLRIAYAQVLIDTGAYAQALTTLEDAVRRSRGTAYVYELMSDAALKAGNRAATHRYRGEKLYAEGDLEPAIRQMELALNVPGLGFHDASKIQVRLDALKAEEKAEEEREDRGRLGRR
jgi:predicted Zn-dependent protease